MTCVCNLTEPCSETCTCRYPFQSGGCMRCCKYGSKEQRIKKAKFLAKAIEIGTKMLTPPHDVEDFYKD